MSLLLVSCDNVVSDNMYSSVDSYGVTSSSDSNTVSTTYEEDSIEMSSGSETSYALSQEDENVARKLKVGEYLTDIEYFEAPFDDNYKISCDEAVNILIDVLFENEMLGKDDHVFFQCTDVVNIYGLAYYEIREYAEDKEFSPLTFTLDRFYVDAETGSVFILGNMGKEDDMRDTLTKLR